MAQVLLLKHCVELFLYMCETSGSEIAWWSNDSKSNLCICFFYLLNIFNPVLALRRLFELLCCIKLLLFFFQLVLKSGCYPPLMQGASWTLAAPFKEQSHYRSPSDSIANNYTLTAQDLKLKNVHKLKSSSMTGTSLGSAERRKASACIHI